LNLAGLKERQTGCRSLNEPRSKSGVIAIVDDDGPLREALGSVLKAAGFSIAAFQSAEDFIDSPLSQFAGCLILDVRLPGMSGIELQGYLARRGSTIPIIFVTAHGDASLHDVVKKAGAFAFLNKPVRSETLLKEIDAALKKTASR
jgi:two-component system response regulator FixJ